jgi:erythromycin esterase-like protein
VLGYLDQVDPEAAQRARFRYACFDRFHEDSQAYGYAASFSMGKTCEDNVVSQLVEMTRARCDYARRPVHDDPDAFFFAEQNARLVKNAEAYYRTMFSGRVSSWNLRDQHMVETLQALDAHLAARASGKGAPRMAVWAHNSHLGDASATEMGQQGEWNVGQLMRERYGDQSFRVGFSTYEGTVTAASAWNGRVERKRVRPGLSGSYEALFHEAGIPRLMLFGDDAALAQALEAPRLQRAIGVVYAPQTERQSHYFHARLFDQFNAMIHIDATHGVEPLEPGPGWMSTEAPDTCPSGL